ncbi:MAG: hypothetical protein C0173_10105 [Desulfurella sp.]|uniref:hypothetical protein n=1 Tax=Desulfurella sp. TaxID=1962857 RepID=UPI000CAEB4CA|nr:hypothetical protein [Desulfurella sp.]PMP87091.1 MAG: hypothetical protein C0173_10105 [Desulfurella sp.]
MSHFIFMGNFYINVEKEKFGDFGALKNVLEGTLRNMVFGIKPDTKQLQVKAHIEYDTRPLNPVVYSAIIHEKDEKDKSLKWTHTLWFRVNGDPRGGYTVGEDDE